MYSNHVPSASPVQETENDLLDSLALLEAFKDAINSFKSLEGSITDISARTIYINQVQVLETLYSILDNNNSPIKLFGDLMIPRSKIEQLGIAGEVTRARTQGLSTAEIATQFNISDSLVRSFFKQMDTLKPSERAAVTNKSVYDFQARIQEYYALMLQQFNRLVGMDDAIAQKYASEVRTTIELAMKLTEKQMDFVKKNEFQAGVAKILLKQAPAQRAEILKLIERCQIDPELVEG